ncbi:MAG: Gfo/Idh/MocA family oxidoreductase [Lentisphaerae bacterium]|nr:Gfo/Idh/MocA family oxidoreductase [Lentisphaerota bacterium]
MERMRVGIVGVGNICGTYLNNLTQMFGDRVEVLGCADVVPERAQTATEQYGLPKTYGSADDIIADPDVELVLNLTIPAGHFDICMAAVEQGKHTYTEKPLSIELDDAKKLVAKAREKGVRVGGAPDTFMGGGHQTCRKLIDDGWIGTPVAATAFMMCHGHESWHPDPGFYYKRGAGPMFDMGPYYLTALVNMVGPVKRVTGSTRITFPERIVTSEPKRGEVIDVEVPTHIAGVLDFASGAVGTIVTSFDVWRSRQPCLEIYGSEGTLSVPDPNSFGGEILVMRHDHKDWSSIPCTHGHAENSRGIGVADIADAIREDRPHRASGDLACHVLEIIHGVHIASDSGRHYDMTTEGVRPDALPREF